MFLNPLSEQMPVQLIVSHVGNAMLLHQGEMVEDYAWVQYDGLSNSVQLVTQEGALQELGVNIEKAMQKPLLQTRELLMIEIGKDYSKKNPRLIKFAAMGGDDYG